MDSNNFIIRNPRYTEKVKGYIGFYSLVNNSSISMKHHNMTVLCNRSIDLDLFARCVLRILKI